MQTKTSLGVFTRMLLLDCCLRSSEWLRVRGRGQEDSVIYIPSIAIQAGSSSLGAQRSTNTPKVQVGNPIPVSWHPSDGSAERLPGTSPSITTACTPASPPPCFLDTKQGPWELINMSALPQTPHLTLDTVEFSLLASVHHLQDQNHSRDFHPCLALQKPSWGSSTWNSSGSVFKQGLRVQTGAACSNRGPVHLAHSKFMSPAPSSPAWAQMHTADCLKTEVIWIK